MGASPETLRVPLLRSGGVMLSYNCTMRCRHCLYRCRPQAGEWMDEAVLDRVLESLKAERRLIDIHLSGGEATLNPALLELAVRKTLEKGIRLSYLETNGFYASTVEKGVEVLAPLKRAGLNAVLVSVSPYHNEKIPLRHTLNCLEAAVEVFGEDGVFPWLSHFIPMLLRLDPETPHTLEEFFVANALTENRRELLGLFPLTPGGRAPEGLDELFVRQPAENFRGGHCLEILTNVDHFHIDPEGNLFTGHCPGIIAARTEDPHREKTLDDDPVFVTLAFGGPHALMEVARDRCGFQADPDGYASPCDLCFQVRRHLFRSEPEAWPELGPATFYA
jgi:Predicted Fe-S oxidoreductases